MKKIFLRLQTWVECLEDRERTVASSIIPIRVWSSLSAMGSGRSVWVSELWLNEHCSIGQYAGRVTHQRETAPAPQEATGERGRPTEPRGNQGHCPLPEVPTRLMGTLHINTYLSTWAPNTFVTLFFHLSTANNQMVLFGTNLEGIDTELYMTLTYPHQFRTEFIHRRQDDSSS